MTILLLFQKLEETITKNSSTLGRDAKYSRKVSILLFLEFNAEVCLYMCRESINTFVIINSHFLQSLLNRIPAYLTIQMVRFYYKEKDNVNAKILKVSGFVLCLQAEYVMT